MPKKQLFVVMNPFTYEVTVCHTYMALAHHLYGTPYKEDGELLRQADNLRKKINRAYQRTISAPFVIIEGHHVWGKVNHLTDRKIYKSTEKV